MVVFYTSVLYWINTVITVFCEAVLYMAVLFMSALYRLNTVINVFDESETEFYLLVFYMSSL